jgi:hypothetical protein
LHGTLFAITLLNIVEEPDYFHMNLATNVLFLCYTTTDNRVSVSLNFKTAILDFPLPVWLDSIRTYSNRMLGLDNVAFRVLFLSYREADMPGGG